MGSVNEAPRHLKRLRRDFVTGGTGLLVPRPAAARGELAGAAEAAAGGRVREAWLRWLAPRFPEGSVYFTGTYSDEYGLPHGLMLPRNVHKDFRSFLFDEGLTGQEFVNGTEEHRYRDVLHLHAIISGDFSDWDRSWLQARWERERGFARVLPVLDGCASYVTKYALKAGRSDFFDWNLA